MWVKNNAVRVVYSHLVARCARLVDVDRLMVVWGCIVRGRWLAPGVSSADAREAVATLGAGHARQFAFDPSGVGVVADWTGEVAP